METGSPAGARSQKLKRGRDVARAEGGRGGRSNTVTQGAGPAGRGGAGLPAQAHAPRPAWGPCAREPRRTRRWWREKRFRW